MKSEQKCEFGELWRVALLPLCGLPPLWKMQDGDMLHLLFLPNNVGVYSLRIQATGSLYSYKLF